MFDKTKVQDQGAHSGGSGLFGSTGHNMANAKITKLERLENAFVQEKFVTELKLAARKYKGKSPSQLVKLLFHGAKNTESKLIYESEHGLDMRFSRDGMYGQGIYFADNARYCHGFARNLGNGLY